MDCGLDGLTFTQPSLCKPQFAAECDLGGIVKRFLRTGELPQFHDRPTIDDASDMPDDFFDALRPVTEIKQAFDQLPVEVRNKFNNDPELWFSDEIIKRDKQLELGLEQRKVHDNAPEKKQDIVEQIEQTQASSSASEVAK